MLPINRRAFIKTGGAATVLGSSAFVPARSFASSLDPPDSTVHFLTDGLMLNPAEYTHLLGKLAADGHAETDRYLAGGCVAEMEARFAAILGKERAIFVPTGTLANHLAIRVQAADKTRVLLQAESHVYADELDSVPILSHLNVVPLAAGRATFTLGDVEEAVNRAAGGPFPLRVGVISIESPVRRKYGEAFDFEEMKKIAAYARTHDIKLHLDGARLFMAPPYTGVSIADYAALFDTVYISLYKYFGAGTGAVLAGPRDAIERVGHERKVFGGVLYHAWPYAAIALHHLDGFEQRFLQAVNTARSLFAKLEEHPRFRIEPVPHGTNIVSLQVKGIDPRKYQASLKRRGVLIREPVRDFPGILLVINESLKVRTPDDLAGAFIDALTDSGEATAPAAESGS
jgi:threonine aldolase